jgi:predicted dehydrogenase
MQEQPRPPFDGAGSHLGPSARRGALVSRVRSSQAGWTEPVRTAVVGLGYWGPNLVRNLNELSAAELLSVCDARPDALHPVSTRYPAVKTTTSYRELLEDPMVEAIVVATPVSTHHELAAAALEAGKHVFVEKPLAASTADALDLVELARAQDLVLMPGHTFLYSPPVNTVRDLIVSGDLGEIYFVSTSRVNLGLHQRDVSVAWDLGPHDFSILRYWLDETPRYVSATSRACIFPSIADVAFINLEFESGVIAHVELSWLAPSKLRRTTIAGSRKMVVYDDTSNEPIRIFDSGVVPRDPESFGEYQLSYRTGDIVSPRMTVAEPLSLELADFCAAIREGATPRSSAELGLEVVRMIEAVSESLAADGARTMLNDAPTRV